MISKHLAEGELHEAAVNSLALDRVYVRRRVPPQDVLPLCSLFFVYFIEHQELRSHLVSNGSIPCFMHLLQIYFNRPKLMTLY